MSHTENKEEYMKGYVEGVDSTLKDHFARHVFGGPTTDKEKAREQGFKDGDRDKYNEDRKYYNDKNDKKDDIWYDFDSHSYVKPKEKKKRKKITDYDFSIDFGSSGNDLGFEEIWAGAWLFGIILYTFIIIFTTSGNIFGRAVLGFLAGLFWPFIALGSFLFGFDGTYAQASKYTFYTEAIIIGLIILFFIGVLIFMFIEWLSDKIKGNS